MHDEMSRFVCHVEIPARPALNLLIRKNHRHSTTIVRKGIYFLSFYYMTDDNHPCIFQDFPYSQERRSPAPLPSASYPFRFPQEK